MKIKICNKCNQEKDLSSFYKAKKNKDGYRNDCKECVSKINKEYRQKNREKNTEKYYQNLSGKKICCKCKIKKNISEFHKDKIFKDGLHPWCKKCRKEYDKERYPRNKEKKAQRSKEYYQKNKEEISKKSKKWRKNNPHRFWALLTKGSHKRRGYKINISNDELEIMAKKTNYCPICDVKLDWKSEKGRLQMNSPSIDNINNQKILNKNNIWIICHKCNATKHNRSLKEFVKYCDIVSKKFKNILGMI